MNNPLLERLAAANILLSYGKADDGVKDGDGAKYRLVRRVLEKPFRRAEKICPFMPSSAVLPSTASGIARKSPANGSAARFYDQLRLRVFFRAVA